MKLSVSAYRAHASAHKKILDTAYNLNYGSVSASHNNQSSAFKVEPVTNEDNTNSRMTTEGGAGSSGQHHHLSAVGGATDNSGSDTPLHSPRSPLNTSRDEDDDSSNPNSSDCKSPSQRQDQDITKSNQRWMKLRTTVQISSAIQKKPPLKREDSFLKRFSTRQIPEAQETVEDTGSEGGSGPGGQGGDQHSTPHRRRRRIQKHTRTVVNPDENFYFYWLLALTVCVLYNLWTLIVRQSFPEFQNMLSNFWLGCDSISDLVFLFDVAVQLRTGYLEQGLMVYDSKKLAGHYLHSKHFLLDLGSLCPLDLLQFRWGPQPMLRFPRFLKVYRAVNYYYMVESRTVWPNLWRVVNLIHILLILAHWFGCFYFLLSEAEGFQGDWVYPYRPGDYATLTRKYLGSLYWSTLTLTTIGDLPTPETNAEKAVTTVDGPRSLPRRGLKSRLLQFNTSGGYVFTIVSYLIGVFIFATIVGQVGNVITNRNANRLEFERLLDGAKMYMRHHKVPSGMKKRVLRWYDYSWSRGRIQGGGDINTALGLLPDKLKTELALHVNLSVLKKVTIFQECQPEFLHDLVLKMKAYIFTPGDSICRKGEVAREMFIIADGILEVISEAGKVLTTMKAGDFFGEIGILNLDGLNKRTADVRSVGYSELFSLSREDVLTAMKDYPEAQEILQALGRKRLMEVRNSARQHATHRKHHDDKSHGGHHRGPVDPRGFVGKIKNEAKGLRNVLRKSRTHRRSDDSLELQPLHTPSKGVLRRMPRVRSDDLSQEDPITTDPPPSNPESNNNNSNTKETTVTSPLGAGLPLLSRLRLLKEKQENEERGGTCHISSTGHSPSSIISPPSVPEEPPNQEVIGAGLPLLQRLLLLKAKEDKLQTGGPSSHSPSPAVSPKPAMNKVSFKDRITTELLKKESTSAIPPPSIVSPPPTSCSPVMEHDDIESSSPLLSVVDEEDSSKCEDKTDESVTNTVTTPSDEICPWSKLKQAAIVRDSLSSGSGDALESADIVPSVIKKPKPSLLMLEGRTKQYESVDDLSPEYCGLPFVKKLKILNERQKLAELEHVMKARSVSLDIPGDNPPQHDETMTRSRSEASAMHSCNTLDIALTEIPPPSPESNETIERRNLKSILKKLSEDPPLLRTGPDRSNQAEMRQLMRAQTIEGYAARHSKLSKSVTFNRDTLQSPPNSANLTGGNQNLFPLIPLPIQGNNNGVDLNIDDPKEKLEQHKELVDKCGIQIISSAANQVKLLKGPFEQEQEYFGEVLVAIKQVISGHLQEMQDKFQQRFDKLEEEVRSRDEVITRLKNHIVELEKTLDDSYTTSAESVDTVVTRRSWDEPNGQECLELQDLPESISPEPTWNTSQQDSVVLDLDSATDTESDFGDSSSQEGLHNTNWEVEMLVAQMRQQRRSASFDHGLPSTYRSTPQARRRLCRGYSAEASRRD